jgi:hypothetical protein
MVARGAGVAKLVLRARMRGSPSACGVAPPAVLNVTRSAGASAPTRAKGLQPGWGNPIDINLAGLPSGVHLRQGIGRAGGPAVGKTSVVVVR